MRSEGLDEKNLVTVGAEIRREVVTTWREDVFDATLWVDLLFRLCLHVMRIRVVQIYVVDTIRQEDASDTPVRLVLTVEHNVGIADGEYLVTSSECALKEKERVDCLVDLSTSLDSDGNNLGLLENTERSKSLESLFYYRMGSIRISYTNMSILNIWSG